LLQSLAHLMGGEFVRVTQAQRRDGYIATGAITGEDLGAWVALSADPALAY
jgi:hypothetical protein